jgi:hypothetical protein
MKKNLLVISLLLTAGFVSGQTTYYWVGGTASTSFTGNSNWNKLLDGSGATRTAADASDILIFDGSNVGGSIPATGTVIAEIASNTIGQLKLINNAQVSFRRPAVVPPAAAGTGTMTIGGGAGDDLVIENGSSLSIAIPASEGTVVIGLAVGATGKISGNLTLSTGAHRLVAQSVGALVFASGASVNTSTSNYPFGTTGTTPAAVQSGVVFESGAHLYYNGGNSPMGNNSTFSAIDFKAGSNYHIRASNGTGSFVNNKSFGNLFVENNATLTADGAIYRIGNFTIESGCSFTTHSSGHTAVLGNLVVDGTFGFNTGSTNTLVLGGSTQTVSGTGTVSVPSLLIADNSSVTLAKNVNTSISVNVYGKLDLAGNRLLGAATFTTRVGETAAGLTGTTTIGSFQLTNVTGIAGVAGFTVTGAGIPANTSVISFSTGSALITLSNPVTASGTNVALTFFSDTATLATAHASGFEETNGSVGLTGVKTYKAGTNYIINAATSKPFGISTTQEDGNIRVGSVVINAPVTVNRGVDIFGHLDLNNKLTLRPDDTLRIRTGAVINGAFSAGNYIVTNGDAGNGEQGLVQYDDLSATTIIPVGSAGSYLPVSITPTASSAFTVSVIEGITADGLVNGTALSSFEKQKLVNASWQINRTSGSGTADLQLQWDAALEGSTFTTLPNTDIGIITNTGGVWGNPLNAGDNTANTATSSVSDFGVFAIGSVPQAEPFVFNEIPVKIYGDADFNGGANSLNTTKPIVYSSSDPLVATIVNGSVHITGAGTASITASQETDGLYPAASLSHTLTVDKAALLIKADNKVTPEAEALPALTATYTGFVYNETPAVLLTPAVLSTTATATSAVGPYPITVSGATAANYTISFADGVMTVQPKQTQTITFGAIAAKKYGNADFTVNATSTNTTIPVTYSSSNTNVATVTGNTIHITGAGSTVITASQAGSALYFPAPSIAQNLAVDKAALTIAVKDTSKVEGQANPAFTITYTGFVYGETAANLSAPALVNTTATATSSAGYYPLTPANAATNNYTVTYTAGRLTILPLAGTGQPYLNAYMSNSTTLTTRIYSNAPALSDIQVWDLNGKPFIRRNAFLPKGFISIDLMVAAVPSGVYIVTVRGNGVDLKQMIRIIK